MAGAHSYIWVPGKPGGLQELLWTHLVHFRDTSEAGLWRTNARELMAEKEIGQIPQRNVHCRGKHPPKIFVQRLTYIYIHTCICINMYRCTFMYIYTSAHTFIYTHRNRYMGKLCFLQEVYMKLISYFLNLSCRRLGGGVIFFFWWCEV